MAVSARPPQAVPAARQSSGATISAPVDLDEDQRRIVEHLAGGLLVLAPVGTGKTTVLAERLAHAVAVGVAPERTLCLTFTNRAARAVRDRLAEHFPEFARRLVVRTFHQLCADILRSEAKSAGLATDFTVTDEADTLVMLRRILKAQDDDGPRRLRDAIERIKLDADVQTLGWPVEPRALFAMLPTRWLDAALRYQRGLMHWQTLDFADLVLQVRALFAHRPDVRERWATRFDLIQVDEAQDTHLVEYTVVLTLAERSGNLALFGDRTQTIYEWRGADPDALLQRFETDFAPVTCLVLRENYRATRPLVAAASALAETIVNSAASVPHASCEDGEPIRLTCAPDEASEADAIARQIASLRSEGGPDFAFRDVAVLARTNSRCAQIAAAFERAGIPYVGAEFALLFRQPEIKDALAYARLLVNPHDTGAALRVWEQGTRELDDGVLGRIRTDGEPVGLRLVDLFQVQTFIQGDPLGRVVDAYNRQRLVVFDVETTGLDPRRDEIIEIAAVRLEDGRTVERFHALLRPTIPVGVSVSIHRLSETMLAAEGRDPAAGLADFLRFVDDDLLVGHNVAFDVRILTAHLARLGMAAPAFETADTYHIAPRFITTHPYTLEALARALRLPHPPTHRAADDVAATADLLASLMTRASRTAAARRELVAREGQPFRVLAESVARWQAAAVSIRPAELLAHVVEHSGLRDRYAAVSGAGDRLDQMLRVCEDHDDGSLLPRDALHGLIEFAALAKGLDHLKDGDDRVPVVTIHQAKGLEFDSVFIPGLTDGGLPLRRPTDGSDAEEERRVLYVALPRARRRLFLSHAETNPWGRRQRPSPFLGPLEPWLARGA